MVTPRWHSPPAWAQMAARLSAHSEVGVCVCFLGAIQREPSQPALEHGGPWCGDGDRSDGGDVSG